jgi:hypothetical protein
MYICQLTCKVLLRIIIRQLTNYYATCVLLDYGDVVAARSTTHLSAQIQKVLLVEWL